MRLILTSRTYQHRYDPSLEDHFDVTEARSPRYYRSPRLRRLTAEQFIDSLRLVTAQALDSRARVYLDDASTALTRSLGNPPRATRSARRGRTMRPCCRLSS